MAFFTPMGQARRMLARKIIATIAGFEVEHCCSARNNPCSALRGRQVSRAVAGGVPPRSARAPATAYWILTLSSARHSEERTRRETSARIGLLRLPIHRLGSLPVRSRALWTALCQPGCRLPLHLLDIGSPTASILDKFMLLIRELQFRACPLLKWTRGTQL